ncbi:unnamed protein product [Fraxinus pennsylvanica]|uniref:AN1-type domain-containing protein n=1 Tax=Fraxinus pennsylvanica TaxID=56036 RepID=A0AAD2AA62_9LAMI|nr:unnamed protein product [Fraxinus pennsylvanica]
MRGAKIAMEKTLNQSKSSSFSRPEYVNSIINPYITHETVPISVEIEKPDTAAVVPLPQQQTKPNMCAACRRRVGLTRFKCKCGVMFCGSHRTSTILPRACKEFDG